MKSFFWRNFHSSLKYDWMKDLRSLSPEEQFKRKLERIRGKKGFLCDLDGVIYRGGHLIEGAKQFHEWCRKEGKKITFVTNNSRSTRVQISEKLCHLVLPLFFRLHLSLFFLIRVHKIPLYLEMKGDRSEGRRGAHSSN